MLLNETLQADWYDGQRSVTQLALHRIAITTIEANAFNTVGLRRLKHLLIMRNPLHIHTYHPAMFMGIQASLTELYIDEQSPRAERRLPTNLLQPLNQTLEEFSFVGDMGMGPALTNLFGCSKMPMLLAIRIICQIPSIRFIAADNFTGLPVIEQLLLTFCGIETIDRGTFDQISDTLLRIELRGNYFIQLNLNAFVLFLDKSPTIATNQRKRLAFRVPARPTTIACSMEFYRIRNATLISFHYTWDALLGMLCKQNVHRWYADDFLMIVHPLRWNLKHDGIYKYAMPRFHINFNAADRTFDIIQFNRDNYRLVMWPIDRKASLENDSAVTTAKCHRSNRTMDTIVVADFNSSLIAACIIHISMHKESVPLNCRTIRLVSEGIVEKSAFAFNWLYFGMAVGVAIAGASILIVICSLRTSNAANGED